MCSITVMHAWAFKGSCSLVIPCYWHFAAQKWWCGKGCAQGETKRSCRLQKGEDSLDVRAERWWRSCRWGEVSNSPEPGWPKAFWDRDRWISSWCRHIKWSECQDASGGPALLCQPSVLSCLETWEGQQLQVQCTIVRNTSSTMRININVKRTSTMATPARLWWVFGEVEA